MHGLSRQGTSIARFGSAYTFYHLQGYKGTTNSHNDNELQSRNQGTAPKRSRVSGSPVLDTVEVLTINRFSVCLHRDTTATGDGSITGEILVVLDSISSQSEFLQGLPRIAVQLEVIPGNCYTLKLWSYSECSLIYVKYR